MNESEQDNKPVEDEIVKGTEAKADESAEKPEGSDEAAKPSANDYSLVQFSGKAGKAPEDNWSAAAVKSGVAGGAKNKSGTDVRKSGIKSGVTSKKSIVASKSWSTLKSRPPPKCSCHHGVRLLVTDCYLLNF